MCGSPGQAAVLQVENIAAPVDAVAHETGRPYERRNQVS
jgi:hypothetical protein